MLLYCCDWFNVYFVIDVVFSVLVFVGLIFCMRSFDELLIKLCCWVVWFCGCGVVFVCGELTGVCCVIIREGFCSKLWVRFFYVCMCTFMLKFETCACVVDLNRLFVLLFCCL